MANNEQIRPRSKPAFYHELVSITDERHVTARIYTRPGSDLVAQETFTQASDRAGNKAAALQWVAGQLKYAP